MLIMEIVIVKVVILLHQQLESLQLQFHYQVVLHKIAIHLHHTIKKVEAHLILTMLANSQAH